MTQYILHVSEALLQRNYVNAKCLAVINELSDLLAGVCQLI